MVPVHTIIPGNYLKAGRRNAKPTISFVVTVGNPITLKRFVDWKKLNMIQTKMRKKLWSTILSPP